MPQATLLQFCIFSVSAAGFNSFQSVPGSLLLQYTFSCQMDGIVVILKPWPTFPCVIHVASNTWQFLRFWLEKSLAFRQFSSVCKLHFIAVIFRQWPTFPCVAQLISDTQSLLEFRYDKSSVIRQFSSALKKNCITVVIRSMPTFQCVVSLCLRHSGISILSRRTHTDDAQIVHSKIPRLISS